MPQPRIFLSHVTTDHSWVSRLEAELKRHGYDVFFAERDLHISDMWPIELARELLSRDVFVIVLTPESWASKWVKAEYSLAELHNKTMVSILLRPTNTISFLEIYQWINGIGQDPKTVAREMMLGMQGIAVEVNQTDQIRALVQRDASYILPESMIAKEYQAWIFEGLEVVLPPTQFIPPGAFKMGSNPKFDKDAEESELPQFEISLPEFYASVYPVTVCEYNCAVRARIVKAPQYSKISWEEQLEHPDHPVVNVSWYDASAYAQWLSRTTEQEWRLLTEAEWERAAKGGKDLIFPWGNRWSIACANTQDRQSGTTTPIGMFREGTNGFGLYDMSGNVWEWCSSHSQAYPYRNNEPMQSGESPQDSEAVREEERCVVRGGSWNSLWTDVRVSKRLAHFPGAISPTVGFRLAKDRA